MVPTRGEAAWAQYAPYDEGSGLRNAIAFLRSARRPPPEPFAQIAAAGEDAV